LNTCSRESIHGEAGERDIEAICSEMMVDVLSYGTALESTSLKIAYFVHDLDDATVQKRVRMLVLGGADVRLAGFHRGPTPPANLAEVAAHSLGQTHDGRLVHRAVLALSWILRPWRFFGQVRHCDVIMARNLETLALAATVRMLLAPKSRLIYECLDIHGSLRGASLGARLLRSIEALLLRQSHLLVVSSPAFINSYFAVNYRLSTPWLLVENKPLLEASAASAARTAAAHIPPGPPWRIGWFGVLRAQKALDALCEIARRSQGLVEIVIRGRPTPVDFIDFHGQVEATPNVVFKGAYTPADLANMYGEIHFNWTLDYLDEAGNSNWLLPNRIYEGGLFGAVAIARRQTETGRWVEGHGVGVLVDDPVKDTVALMETMTAELFAKLAQAAAIDLKYVTADAEACTALVEALGV
jgi:hypothetical protein